MSGLRSVATLPAYVLASLVLMFSTQVVPAVAQGSTGGTLGKTDQSISGDQRRPPPPAKSSPPKKAAAPGPQPEKGGRCPNIVGVWNSWASGMWGKGDTTFKSDGSATHSPGGAGKWWCANGQLHIDWGGSGKPGPVRLSADGKKMLGSDGGIHMSRD